MAAVRYGVMVRGAGASPSGAITQALYAAERRDLLGHRP
jgi:hypothetical protein